MPLAKYTKAPGPYRRKKTTRPIDVSELRSYFRLTRADYALEMVQERLAFHRDELEARNRQQPRLTAARVRAALRQAAAGLEPLLEPNRVDSSTYRRVRDAVRATHSELRAAEKTLPKKFDDITTELLGFTIPWLKKIYEDCAVQSRNGRAMRKFVCASLEIAKLPRPKLEEHPSKLTDFLKLPLIKFTGAHQSRDWPTTVAPLIKDVDVTTRVFQLCDEFTPIFLAYFSSPHSQDAHTH